MFRELLRLRRQAADLDASNRHLQEKTTYLLGDLDMARAEVVALRLNADTSRPPVIDVMVSLIEKNQM